MDDRIVKFLKKMHLASVCVIDEEGQPYAFSAFYAFDEVNFSLLLASSDDSSHIKFLKNSKLVAGTVALDTKIVGKIEGVQFQGVMREAKENEIEIYFERFFYAKAMDPKIWCINLEKLKFTSNILGFGKKIKWEKGGKI
ncbi:pyridoxamine 5'-phosphate oxidase family protein [Campylobacter concisus]|uniref:pyridoxamine 5'-phosphate oxidase family protein n=1 Tax=Campylobacter concisus TaxID=199 RepID=UPI000D30704C|nr:pyridoxamine 5'-phosphate oxidase family protein [Campylobacter concisus]